jgi:hypothetical protein
MKMSIAEGQVFKEGETENGGRGSNLCPVETLKRQPENIKKASSS